MDWGKPALPVVCLIQATEQRLTAVVGSCGYTLIAATATTIKRTKNTLTGNEFVLSSVFPKQIQ